jgi:hypothetical protein
LTATFLTLPCKVFTSEPLADSAVDVSLAGPTVDFSPAAFSTAGAALGALSGGAAFDSLVVATKAAPTSRAPKGLQRVLRIIALTMSLLPPER